jgi:hypothetical protein
MIFRTNQHGRKRDETGKVFPTDGAAAVHDCSLSLSLYVEIDFKKFTNTTPLSFFFLSSFYLLLLA